MSEDKEIIENVTSAVGADQAVRRPREYDITAESDPMKWAHEFKRIREERLARDGFDIAEDPGTLVGWFANAFARGEWNSPHYKEWLAKQMQALYPQDSDNLDLVGTNTQDIGRPHVGGQYTTRVTKMSEYWAMIREKASKRVPLAKIQYDDQGSQLLITDVDETRLKKERK